MKAKRTQVWQVLALLAVWTQSGLALPYWVHSGETVGGVAHKFNVTVADLLQANPQIADPDQLVAGERIIVPNPQVKAGTADKADFYRIQAGDTLAGVANSHAVTVAALLATNPRITDADRIVAGEVLALPYTALPEDARLVRFADGTVHVMTALDRVSALNATIHVEATETVVVEERGSQKASWEAVEARLTLEGMMRTHPDAFAKVLAEHPEYAATIAGLGIKVGQGGYRPRPTPHTWTPRPAPRPRIIPRR
jgi:LysM repeat protein